MMNSTGLQTEQKDIKEFTDSALEFFTPAEKKQVMISLANFIDAGNNLSDTDIKILLSNHLRMYPREIKIYSERAPLTTWVHTSILGPQQEWMISSVETIAILYNPSYEGEHYFTLGPITDRQSIHTKVAYFLFALETSDDSLKNAIQQRKEYLRSLIENPGLDPLNLDIYQWLHLCQKITEASYSQPLKLAITLDLFYNAYLCIKNTILLPEHIDTLLFTFDSGLNSFYEAHKPSSHYYEIFNLLLSAMYYHCAYLFEEQSQLSSYHTKARYYFEKAIQYDIQLTHLLHHDWIKDLKDYVFECYFNHIPAQKETLNLNNQNLVFKLHQGMTELDCVAAIKVAYQNISLEITKPTQRARYLLTLCESAQKACFITDNLIYFLLDIYYEIYIIFNNPKKVLSDYHEIMFEFFVGLKKIIIMENTDPKFHEIINILLCTPFVCGMQLQNNCNTTFKNEYADLYFKRAIECHITNNETIQHDWANPLRMSMLRSIQFKDNPNNSSIEKIVVALIKRGNELATTWLKPEFTKLLSPKERKNINKALNYYDIIIWLESVKLYDDTFIKCLIATKAKINALRQHLERSLTEEQLLITRPIITYVQGNNPISPYLHKLIQSAEYQKQKFLLTLRDTAEKKLTHEQFQLLIEICNEKLLSYTPDINIIIWLDLFYQIYHFVKKNKIITNNNVLAGFLENDVLLLQRSKDENDMLQEACLILLFHLGHLRDKTTRESPEFHEKLRSIFIRAIQFNTTQFLKTDWMKGLRKKALMRYAKYFSTLPGIKFNTSSLEKLFLYLNVIHKTKKKNKDDKRYILEAQHILSWATGVELITRPLPQLSTGTYPEIIEPSAEINTENETLEKQKKSEARRIKAEKQREEEKRELEAKEALDQLEREKEKKTREETQANLALLNAQEAERKNHEKEQRVQRQAANRAAKQAEKARQDAEKLKLFTQEQALKEQKQKQEQADIELKQQQEQEACAKHIYETETKPLIEHNSVANKSRKTNILERPLRSLRNFSLDELTHTELSADNQKSLCGLINTLGNFGTLEIYGSYVIFLASLRLGLDLEKIKTPGDMDIRIKLLYNTLENYSVFIEKLFTLGFECKEFNEKFKCTTLQDYLAKKQNHGYINLSKPSMPNVVGSYEIELAILFPNYRPNTYPFTLLKHYISIEGTTASFNHGNIKATTQLANCILKKTFDCDLHEVMDLKYNVFNFFPRAIKNILAWAAFFNVKKGNWYQIFTNPKLMEDFFSMRFYARKHKDCYLEIAGLITQQYFLIPEANRVLQGFFKAFLSMLNIEANDRIKQNLISPKSLSLYAIKITKELKSQFVQDPKLFGESKEKHEICQAFYIQLVKCIDKLFIQGDTNKKVFLENSRVLPTSILFDLFKAFKQPKPLSELEPMESISPCPSPPLTPYTPHGPVCYGPPCMMMPNPAFYPHPTFVRPPPPVVYSFAPQPKPFSELPPPYSEETQANGALP